jgi:hypothetical protein
MTMRPRDAASELRQWIARVVRDPYALHLSPRPAALLGAIGGVLVGLAMAVSMARHAVFTQAHQDVTAGAALVLIWLVIGVIAGLTVLSPTGDDRGE